MTLKNMYVYAFVLHCITHSAPGPYQSNVDNYIYLHTFVCTLSLFRQPHRIATLTLSKFFKIFFKYIPTYYTYKYPNLKKAFYDMAIEYRTFFCGFLLEDRFMKGVIQ